MIPLHRAEDRIDPLARKEQRADDPIDILRVFGRQRDGEFHRSRDVLPEQEAHARGEGRGVRDQCARERCPGAFAAETRIEREGQHRGAGRPFADRLIGK